MRSVIQTAPPVAMSSTLILLMYRVIYQYTENEIYIGMIGPRADGDVYNSFSRQQS